MRTVLEILIICFVFMASSCSKEEDENHVDFYDLNQRIGYWINSEREDTLYFVNDTELKRFFNGEEDYLYRIDENYLYVRTPISLIETTHEIMDNTEDKVMIGNMYRGYEQTINYGIYQKLNN